MLSLTLSVAGQTDKQFELVQMQNCSSLQYLASQFHLFSYCKVARSGVEAFALLGPCASGTAGAGAGAALFAVCIQLRADGQHQHNNTLHRGQQRFVYDASDLLTASMHCLTSACIMQIN